MFDIFYLSNDSNSNLILCSTLQFKNIFVFLYIFISNIKLIDAIYLNMNSTPNYIRNSYVYDNLFR